MKKIPFLLILFLCLGIITSCNDNSFLGGTQITDLDKDAVFADSSYTAGFLTQIYADVGFETKLDRFNGGLQTSCDEAEFKKQSYISADAMFTTGTVNPLTCTSDAWDNCYRNIRRVNVFLKYADKSPMDEDTKVVYKAEARFLRAWYYSILLRHYGGIPLVGDFVAEDVSDIDKLKTSRDSYSDCVDYIINECETAAKSLPNKRAGRENGRAGAGACYSLISRVRLFAASKLFNGSNFAPEGYDKELVGYADYDLDRWRLASEAAKKVIELNAFKMYERHADNTGNAEPGWGFYALFQAKDWYQLVEWDGENYPSGAYCGTILEAKEGDGRGRESLFTPPSCGGNGQGGYIYYELAEAFPMKDGKSINSSKYSYNVLTPNENRDPRFANTVIYNGCKVRSGGDGNHLVYTYTGSGSTSDAIYAGTPTGYYTRKQTSRDLAANYFVGGPQSRPLMRYAEILLNYAEATNEYYGPDHIENINGENFSPYTVLQSIRKRAGIEAGENQMYGLKEGMSQDEMREAIRLERRLELAFEGFRFWDVRRWMIAEETDNKTMHGLEITSSLTGKVSSKVIPVRTHVFRKAMYLWPLPYNETVKCKDLLQNPYYE